MPAPRVRAVRCAPKTHPRPTCGKSGRRKRGRPSKGAKKRAAGKGPTNKQKAAPVFKGRYLIVKRAENLSERERADLEVMFGYLPELKVLWRLSQEIYKAWQTEQSRKVARWNRLVNNKAHQDVAKLAVVLEWLDGKSS